MRRCLYHRCMRTISQEGGRINQKRRTRAAIVAAAAELVRQGKSPTVAEVADAALVSRATAYRYFPSQEYLLSEAALEGIRGEIDEVLQAADSIDDPAMRFDVVLRALQEQTVEQEAGFRALLRLSLEQPFERIDRHEPGVPGRRGARRLDWIEQALAPVWRDLDPQTRKRLLGALSLCMGIEAIVVLRDICGYSAAETIEISAWAAQAILQSGLHAPRLQRTKLDEGGT
jgi:AcrR family transcriptional regulator